MLGFSTARYYLQLFILPGIKDRFMMLVKNSKGTKNKTIGTQIFFLALDFILLKSSFLCHVVI